LEIRLDLAEAINKGDGPTSQEGVWRVEVVCGDPKEFEGLLLESIPGNMPEVGAFMTSQQTKKQKGGGKKRGKTSRPRTRGFRQGIGGGIRLLKFAETDADTTESKSGGDKEMVVPEEIGREGLKKLG